MIQNVGRSHVNHPRHCGWGNKNFKTWSKLPEKEDPRGTQATGAKIKYMEKKYTPSRTNNNVSQYKRGRLGTTNRNRGGGASIPDCRQETRQTGLWLQNKSEGLFDQPETCVPHNYFSLSKNSAGNLCAPSETGCKSSTFSREYGVGNRAFHKVVCVHSVLSTEKSKK